MINVWLCVVLVLIALACGIAIGYFVFYKKGMHVGEKKKEIEFFTDYVEYWPIKEIEELADSLLNDENDPTSPDFPILIVKPNKYDWIDGYGVGAGMPKDWQF